MAQTINTIFKRYAGLKPGDTIPDMTEAQRTTVVATVKGQTWAVGMAVRILLLTTEGESLNKVARKIANETGVSESRVKHHAGFWQTIDKAGLTGHVDEDLYLSAQRWYYANDKNRGTTAEGIGTKPEEQRRDLFLTESVTAVAMKRAAEDERAGKSTGARTNGHKGKQEQEQAGSTLTKQEQEQAEVKVKHPLAQFTAHLQDARAALKGYVFSEAEAERVAEDLVKFQEDVQAMIDAAAEALAQKVAAQTPKKRAKVAA